jgi:hypothetical protein
MLLNINIKTKYMHRRIQDSRPISPQHMDAISPLDIFRTTFDSMKLACQQHTSKSSSAPQAQRTVMLHRK